MRARGRARRSRRTAVIRSRARRARRARRRRRALRVRHGAGPAGVGRHVLAPRAASPRACRRRRRRRWRSSWRCACCSNAAPSNTRRPPLGVDGGWPRLRQARAGGAARVRRSWMPRCCGGWPAPAAFAPAEVAAWTDADLARLWRECAAAAPIERRRVFHEAYERTYRRWILDAVAARRALPDRVVHRPAARAVRVLHRRARGIDSPRGRGAAPRLPHLRRGRVLRRGHRLPGPLRPRARRALPGRGHARARGLRAAGLHRARVAHPAAAPARPLARLGAARGVVVAHAERRRRLLAAARPGLGRQDLVAGAGAALVQRRQRPRDGGRGAAPGHAPVDAARAGCRDARMAARAASPSGSRSTRRPTAWPAR